MFKCAGSCLLESSFKSVFLEHEHYTHVSLFIFIILMSYIALVYEVLSEQLTM
jgi:hypothetical protein